MQHAKSVKNAQQIISTHKIQKCNREYKESTKLQNLSEWDRGKSEIRTNLKVQT